MRLFLAFAALLFAVPAYAACTNPALPEGATAYLAGSNALAFCDGTNWRLTGVSDPSAGTSGCSSPSGTEGTLIFENTQNQYQFCNGDDWIAMGPAAPAAADTGCTNGGVRGQLKYSTTASWLQYCNGEDWVNAGVVTCPGCQNYPGAKLEMDFTRGLAWLDSTPVALPSLLTVTRTGSATYTEANGYVRHVPANTLRTGTQGLLVEEARTNLVVNSEDLSAWNSARHTVTTANLAAPDGGAAHKTLYSSDSVNSTGRTAWSSPVTAGDTYTFTGWFAAVNGYPNTMAMGFYNTLDGFDAANAGNSTFGVISGQGSWSDGTNIRTLTGLSTTSWTRVRVTTTITSSANERFFIYPTSGSGQTSAGLAAWGLQVEKAPFPTNYIPTNGAVVARGAESVVANVANVGIDPAQGTMLANIATQSYEYFKFFGLTDDTGGNFISFRHDPNGRLSFAGTANPGGTQINVTDFVSRPYYNGKWAIAYATGDYGSSVSGTASMKSTQGVVPVTTKLRLNGLTPTFGLWNGYIKSFSYWPTRKSEEALQHLTAP